MDREFEYYCLLLKRTIDDGLCLEINYEYSNFFKTNILESYSIKNKEIAEEVCKICKHYPL